MSTLMMVACYDDGKSNGLLPLITPPPGTLHYFIISHPVLQMVTTHIITLWYLTLLWWFLNCDLLSCWQHTTQPHHTGAEMTVIQFGCILPTLFVYSQNNYCFCNGTSQQIISKFDIWHEETHNICYTILIKLNPLKTIMVTLFTIMAHLIIFKTITKFLLDLYGFCEGNLCGFTCKKSDNVNAAFGGNL